MGWIYCLRLIDDKLAQNSGRGDGGYPLHPLESVSDFACAALAGLRVTSFACFKSENVPIGPCTVHTM